MFFLQPRKSEKLTRFHFCQKQLYIKGVDLIANAQVRRETTVTRNPNWLRASGIVHYSAQINFVPPHQTQSRHAG